MDCVWLCARAFGDVYFSIIYSTLRFSPYTLPFTWKQPVEGTSSCELETQTPAMCACQKTRLITMQLRLTRLECTHGCSATLTSHASDLSPAEHTGGHAAGAFGGGGGGRNRGGGGGGFDGGDGLHSGSDPVWQKLPRPFQIFSHVPAFCGTETPARYVASGGAAPGSSHRPLFAKSGGVQLPSANVVVVHHAGWYPGMDELCQVPFVQL